MDMPAEPVLDVAVEEVARLLGARDPSGEGVALADVRAKAASELSRYGDKLLSDLNALGITVPPAIQLQSSDDEWVKVVGDHPAARQIADLINGDTCLLKWFKEVEVLHALVRRVEVRKSGQAMTAQHFNLGVTSIGCIVFFTEG